MIPITSFPLSNRDLLSIFYNMNKSYQNRELQSKLRKYLKVKSIHTTSQGRSAFYIALKSLNLEKGSEIIIPAYTCGLLIEIVHHLGYNVKLVDVNESTANINTNLIEQNINDKTKVIVPIHMFGSPADMRHIMEISEKNDLIVIEDAAQALGAKYRGKKAGALGDISILSFGPGKNISGGAGGAIVTNNLELIENIELQILELSKLGWLWDFRMLQNIFGLYILQNRYLYSHFHHFVKKSIKKEEKGIVEYCQKFFNSINIKTNVQYGKMANISSTMLLQYVDKIDQYKKYRTYHAQLYMDWLPKDEVVLLKPLEESESAYNRFAIRITRESQKNLKQFLFKSGVDIGHPYSYLPQILPYFGKYPVAEKLGETLVTLPNAPNLGLKDIRHIVESVKNYII